MELNTIVPWGRSLKEYQAMFSLSAEDLQKSLLGCGDGPASFNAELSQQGGQVVSCDPIYAFSDEEIQSRIDAVYNEILQQVALNKSAYIWKSISSTEELGKIRMRAMSLFLKDFNTGQQQGRYIQASLPVLPFQDKQFDLALCSHYLFLYSQHVDLTTHIASLKELVRVAKEVRIYPLLSLDGKLSPHINGVISALTEIGVVSECVDVNYEFQKGANQMLVLTQP